MRAAKILPTENLNLRTPAMIKLPTNNLQVSVSGSRSRQPAQTIPAQRIWHRMTDVAIYATSLAATTT
ncbi:hypothetical protein ParKJ_22310 [Paraburkholderia fungorum]|uniref:Uncharacterized protein n=1 Tax=Paraburkholderia fungorum TaxID=134537 RepID=A0AAP5UXC9_9BURK|nr:hypothetical protein [Paraburkholderia fungorum]